MQSDVSVIVVNTVSWLKVSRTRTSVARDNRNLITTVWCLEDDSVNTNTEEDYCEK